MERYGTKENTWPRSEARRKGGWSVHQTIMELHDAAIRVLSTVPQVAKNGFGPPAAARRRSQLEHGPATQVTRGRTAELGQLAGGKRAWKAAKTEAGVQCRFHDLRDTGCTRRLEAGVPFSVVASIMGWSASTTVRMAKRYGHIGNRAQRARRRYALRVYF